MVPLENQFYYLKKQNTNFLMIMGVIKTAVTH
jgi:hypothetical protein